MSIRRVLVANRGEIAVRIVRACRAMGIESVVAVSEADKGSLAAVTADRAVCIGPARASQSYLNQEALVAAALGTGCDAVHPGYGFLAENAGFAEACERHDVRFVGPSAEAIRTMGNKLAAREVAERNGVPLLPGSTQIPGVDDAAWAADEVGYPVLLKAAAGGGGRGIRVVREPWMLRDTYQQASAEAEAAFGDATLYLERYVATARHIEVQVMADEHGAVLHLGERDCSLQRRYQKIVEEAPAALLPHAVRESLRQSAVALARAVDYENAGTVEFIYDEERAEYYFLEMNTRIQVEHTVTEEVTGLDLVQTQIRVASGEPLPLRQDDVSLNGHAIQCRITAESPHAGFRPTPGRIEEWSAPRGPGIRLDTHCHEGYTVPPFYDSLLAKLVVHGDDRAHATERLQQALRAFRVTGVDTTVGFLSYVTEHADFECGRLSTRWVEDNLEGYGAA